MAITPNMNLDLPTPEVTLGPEWAQKIVDALELVDTHDHSTDHGIKITPAGINITADLPFNGFQATGLKTAALASQGSALGVGFVGVIYRVGSDLYYNNGSGTAIQLTSGNAIATPSGIFSVYVPAAYPFAVTSAQAQTVIAVDTSLARTINLPAATNQVHVIIKDANNNAATNNISVIPNGSDTIDGLNATFLIDADKASYNFISDGVSKWLVV